MGAWGIHFDECDGSLDFLGEVRDSRDWSEVDMRIRDYVADGGYDDGEEALAAAELVAAALGSPSPRLEPGLASWAAEHEPEALALRADAVTAVTLVRDSSELSELWADADEAAGWHGSVEALLVRLQSVNDRSGAGQ
jgi:hypothetical protein